MPYDTYQLYQIERAKSPAEVRRADEQAARLASAASSLFRAVTRPWRAQALGNFRPHPAIDGSPERHVRPRLASSGHTSNVPPKQ